MKIEIDGANIFYKMVGPEQNYPLFLLHGGPGMDHTYMHPWLDMLSDTFRLIYVDQRGQGRSDRVDPATVTLPRLAEDVTQLAKALGIDDYAVLGHSYGAFVALAHALEQNTASHYIISNGSASMSKSMREVNENLAAFKPIELRDQVTESWAREPLARTQEDAAEILRMQMPFHFARVESEAYRTYTAEADRAVYSPDVLAYAASNEYHMEFEDRLHSIDKPILFITGELDRTTTPRAAREMHAAVPHSELVIVPQAGHMAFVEERDLYSEAVRSFYGRNPAKTHEQTRS
ncbi:MAG: alpha/beta fold hydrolase [Chloroflexota bacterium]